MITAHRDASLPRIVHGGAALLGGALLVTSLAACSFDGFGATASPSEHPSSRVRSTASTTARSEQAVVSGCTDRDLRVSVSKPSAASQHEAYVLLFRNVSGSTCTLHGYPGLDVVRNGTVVAHAERTLRGYLGGSRHGVPTVRVPAGGYASAVAEFAEMRADDSGEQCATAQQIVVTAANTSRAVTFDRRATVCTLQVHPTVAGRRGGDR